MPGSPSPRSVSCPSMPSARFPRCCAASWWAAARSPSRSPSPPRPSRPLRPALRAAVPVVAVSGFYMLLSYVDILVLQHLRSSQEVALYHAAAKTLTLVTFVYFAVACPLMCVVGAGLLARAALGPAERLLTMLNEQRACALVYASAFAFNLVACVALVPRYGGMGAAVAPSLALMLESVLRFQVAKRRLGLNVFVFSRSDLAGQPMRALRQIALAFGGRATPPPPPAPPTAGHLSRGGRR